MFLLEDVSPVFLRRTLTTQSENPVKILTTDAQESFIKKASPAY